jgi:hypothetical protein
MSFFLDKNNFNVNTLNFKLMRDDFRNAIKAIEARKIDELKGCYKSCFNL